MTATSGQPTTLTPPNATAGIASLRRSTQRDTHTVAADQRLPEELRQFNACEALPPLGVGTGLPGAGFAGGSVQQVSGFGALPAGAIAVKIIP